MLAADLRPRLLSYDTANIQNFGNNFQIFGELFLSIFCMFFLID